MSDLELLYVLVQLQQVVAVAYAMTGCRIFPVLLYTVIVNSIRTRQYV
jgi:hypothetical protein